MKHVTTSAPLAAARVHPPRRIGLRAALAGGVALAALLGGSPTSAQGAPPPTFQDGIVRWGEQEPGTFPLPPIPPLPTGTTWVDVDVGTQHVVGRGSDGQIVAWGDNGNGQCNVPAPPAGTAYVEVSTGRRHTLGRRSDGEFVTWGDSFFGQLDVPPLPAGEVYLQISGGAYHSLALTGTPRWTDLGNALPGSNGQPRLWGEGSLGAESPLTLRMADLNADAMGALFVGFTRVDLPLKGGVVVPAPDQVVVSITTDPVGALALPTIWPAAAAGITAHLQAWVLDPAGPEGAAATNALQATAP